jgi:hypothetical protein
MRHKVAFYTCEPRLLGNKGTPAWETPDTHAIKTVIDGLWSKAAIKDAFKDGDVPDRVVQLHPASEPRKDGRWVIAKVADVPAAAPVSLHLVFHRMDVEQLGRFLALDDGTSDPITLPPGKHGVTHTTHLVFFESGVVGRLLIRDAPGLDGICRYLKTKTTVDMALKPIFDPDAMKRFDDGRVSWLEITFNRSQAAAMFGDDGDLEEIEKNIDDFSNVRFHFGFNAVDTQAQGRVKKMAHRLLGKAPIAARAGVKETSPESVTDAIDLIADDLTKTFETTGDDELTDEEARKQIVVAYNSSIVHLTASATSAKEDLLLRAAANSAELKKEARKKQKAAEKAEKAAAAPALGDA